MAMNIIDKLANSLQERRDLGLYRSRVIWETEKFLSFIDNDYLGLANHHSILEACKRGVDKYGVSRCASPLLGGYCEAHRALEEELADFTGYPKVLLFSTGYSANIGVVTALFNRKDHIFADRLNHASLNDGGFFCGARLERYLHCNMQDLKKRLLKSTAANKLICSDGVFSMDGDIAPLTDLVSIAKQSNCVLMIDDAHGIGVIGKQGRGSLSQFDLSAKDVPILIGTLSKALATFGAFVATTDVMRESLIQYSHSYIYSTALPPGIAMAAIASLRIIRRENWRREYLQELINHFKTGARELGLNVSNSDAPIQILSIGATKLGQQINSLLLQKRIVVGLVRPPSVPTNGTRLRINLTVRHNKKQIDYLLDLLQKIVKKYDKAIQ